MVVVTLIALASVGVTLALRDSSDSALDRDAQRLAAVLEAARAQARANDSLVWWQARGEGFVLQGLPGPQTVQPWLSPDTRTSTTTPLLLGPEPLLAPQQVVLWNARRPEIRRQVSSDGLRPFALQAAAP